MLADTVTDLVRQPIRPISHLEDLQQFKSIRIANHIELHIRLASDHNSNPNRISVPLMIVDHVRINTSALLASDGASLVDFTFKIIFTKSFDMASLIQRTIPAFVAIAILLTALKTYRYKTRQQRLFYDVDIFGKVLLYVAGHAADVLFACAAFLSLFVFWVRCNQSVMRIVLPIGTDQQHMLDVFLYVAVPLKVRTSP